MTAHNKYPKRGSFLECAQVKHVKLVMLHLLICKGDSKCFEIHNDSLKIDWFDRNALKLLVEMMWGRCGASVAPAALKYSG